MKELLILKIKYLKESYKKCVNSHNLQTDNSDYNIAALDNNPLNIRKMAKKKKNFNLEVYDENGKYIGDLKIEEKMSKGSKKRTYWDDNDVKRNPHLIVRGFPGGLVGYIPLDIPKSNYKGSFDKKKIIMASVAQQYDWTPQSALDMHHKIKAALLYAIMREGALRNKQSK